jgi:hypothetical protein
MCGVYFIMLLPPLVALFIVYIAALKNKNCLRCLFQQFSAMSEGL